MSAMIPPIDPGSDRQRRILAVGMTLGLQMAVGMAVFAGGGHWIDQKRGGGNLFTLLGVFLGLFYMGYEVWKLVRDLKDDDS